MIKVELLKSITPKQEVSRAKDAKNKPAISFDEVLKKAEKQSEKGNTQKVANKNDKESNTARSTKVDKKGEKNSNKETKDIKIDHSKKKDSQKEEKKISHKVHFESKTLPLADAKVVEIKKAVNRDDEKTNKNTKNITKATTKLNKSIKTDINYKDKKHIKLTVTAKEPIEDKKTEIEEIKGKKKDSTNETAVKDKTSIEKTGKHKKTAKVIVTRKTKEKSEIHKESEKREIENRKIDKKEIKVATDKETKTENKIEVAENTKADRNEKINLRQEETNTKKQSKLDRVTTKETKADQKNAKKIEVSKNTTHGIKVTKTTEVKHLTLKTSKTKVENKEQYKQKPADFDNEKIEKEVKTEALTENKETQKANITQKQKEQKERVVEIKQTTDEIKQGKIEKKEIKTVDINQNKQKVKQSAEKTKTEKNNNNQSINVTKVDSEKDGIKSTQNQANQSFSHNDELSKKSEDTRNNDTKDTNNAGKHTQEVEFKTTIETKAIHNNNAPNIHPHTLTSSTTNNNNTALDQSNLHPPLDKVIEEIDKITNLKPPVTKSITVKLNPPHLGNLHLKVSLDIQRNLTASIAVHDKDTYKTIVNHLDSLKEYLVTNGIKVQNIDVHNSFNENFMNQFSGGSGSFQQQGQANGNQAQSGGFSYTFRGNVQTEEASSISRRTPAKGIDITA